MTLCPLKLELQAVMNLPTWVFGAKLRFSRRAMSALNILATSLHPIQFYVESFFFLILSVANCIVSLNLEL